MNAKPKSFDVISQATLRDSDLLQSMTSTLEYYRPKKYMKLIKESNLILKQYGDFGYISYIQDGDIWTAEMDYISWLINEDLFDAMQDIAPAGCHFGSHPGDGALIGFWPFEDSSLWE